MTRRKAVAAIGVFAVAAAAAVLLWWGSPGASDAATPQHETPCIVPYPRKPDVDRGSWSARLISPVNAYKRPGKKGGKQRLHPLTRWSGQGARYLVTGMRCVDNRLWVRLLMADRPNGRTAWVLRDLVKLQQNPFWVRVSVKDRRVTVLRNGRRVKRFRAVVGAPSTPTPRGLAAIYEKVPQQDPNAFLGTWALHLTAHSNVLFNYGGGPGRVAIHGRGGASLNDPLGAARSHGCIRINNKAVNWLASKLPAGTPVEIRSTYKRSGNFTNL